MAVDRILSLLGAIKDLGDLCLILVGIFSGPRASEAMGFQWKSWTGFSLVLHGTAVEGKFFEGRVKPKESRAPIAVPGPVRPVIEAWKKICPDPSLDALMFPTFGRGERKGQPMPRHAKNFLMSGVNYSFRRVASLRNVTEEFHPFLLGICDRLR